MARHEKHRNRPNQEDWERRENQGEYEQQAADDSPSETEEVSERRDDTRDGESSDSPPNFGREVKIGLAVIAALVLVLGVVIYKKVTRPAEEPVAAAEEQKKTVAKSEEPKKTVPKSTSSVPAPAMPKRPGAGLADWPGEKGPGSPTGSAFVPSPGATAVAAGEGRPDPFRGTGGMRIEVGSERTPAASNSPPPVTNGGAPASPFAAPGPANPLRSALDAPAATTAPSQGLSMSPPPMREAVAPAAASPTILIPSSPAPAAPAAPMTATAPAATSPTVSIAAPPAAPAAFSAAPAAPAAMLPTPAPPAPGPVAPVIVPPSPPIAAAPPPSIPPGGSVYVVQEGDTLYDIARSQLGKASRWGEIYDLNRDRLGGALDALPAGTRLAIPGEAMTLNPSGPIRR